MIEKNDQGKWLADIQPGGRGNKRFRKTFKNKVDAIQWVNQINAKHCNGNIDLKSDNRTLNDLIDLWFNLHGVNLKSASDTYKRLLASSKAMNNPRVNKFNPSMFASYRSDRIAKGIKPATLNRERASLRSVFSELSRLGHWSGNNPMHTVRVIRVNSSELTYLKNDEIVKLFEFLQNSSNLDVFLVSKIALATGARWSEVEKLQLKDISLTPSMISYNATKNGKSRYVPISLNLAQEVHSRLCKGNFISCYAAFRSALRRSGIKLPSGQNAHVLRHTFASHFVMNGGDIVTLRQLLGHSSLTVTMRYSHLAPSYLDQVVKLNPLNVLTDC